MKKFVLLIFFSAYLTAGAQAQHVLVEHFTNTPCPICAQNNPKIYNVLDQFAGKVHHISIHTDSPYPSCVLHNFNAQDNKARQNYYDVFSTPRVYVNGKSSSASQEALLAQDIEAALANARPLTIVVTESQGVTRDLTLTISNSALLEASDYRLFIAIVEEEVNYQAPNGENLHHDVLRDYVTSADGDPIDLPKSGQSMENTYEITIPDGVQSDEAYVLAYVQDVNTREILGSGTKFDETITSTPDLTVVSGLKLFPNPASEHLEVQVDAVYAIQRYEILSMTGATLLKESIKSPADHLSIETANLPSGNYILSLQLNGGKATMPFTRE